MSDSTCRLADAGREFDIVDHLETTVILGVMNAWTGIRDAQAEGDTLRAAYHEARLADWADSLGHWLDAAGVYSDSQRTTALACALNARYLAA